MPRISPTKTRSADAAAAVDRIIGANPGFERQRVSAQRGRVWNGQFAEPADIPAPVYRARQSGIVERRAIAVLDRPARAGIVHDTAELRESGHIGGGRRREQPEREMAGGIAEPGHNEAVLTSGERKLGRIAISIGIVEISTADFNPVRTFQGDRNSTRLNSSH